MTRASLRLVTSPSQVSISRAALIPYSELSYFPIWENFAQTFSEYPPIRALVVWSFLAKAVQLGCRSCTKPRVLAVVSLYEIEGVRMLKTVEIP